MNYEKTALTLVEIIKTEIGEHPEILEMSNPFDLFKIEGFGEKIAHLEPSLAQAGAALCRAQQCNCGDIPAEFDCPIHGEFLGGTA